jgi:nucleoside-diphosphate-sugar epimerase
MWQGGLKGRMKTVLITGAGGFIATNLAEVLNHSGCMVIGTSRRLDSRKGFERIYHAELGEPLQDVFAEHHIDGLVHCAFDKSDITHELNRRGTILWAQQAEDNGVPLQMFLSSVSSFEGATSPYGRSKYDLEQWFKNRNHLTFRLGLVIGKGGIYQTLTSLIKRYPFFPLIDGGRTLTYLSDIKTVSYILRDSIINPDLKKSGGVWRLYQRKPVFFVDLLKLIRELQQTSCLFIPVPFSLLYFGLGLVEKVKFLKLDINRNNLLGLRQNSRPGLTSDLDKFGYPELDISDLIRKHLVDR